MSTRISQDCGQALPLVPPSGQRTPIPPGVKGEAAMQMRCKLTCTLKGPGTRYGGSDNPESYTDLFERTISLAEVTSRSRGY